MSGKPAARVSDPTACPLPGHGTNPTTSGSPDVLINNLPTLRVGDSTACGDAVAEGIGSIVQNINLMDNVHCFSSFHFIANEKSPETEDYF